MEGDRMEGKTKGAVYSLIYSGFTVLSNTFSRMAGDLPALEKVYIRSFFVAAFAVFVAMKSREPVIPSKKAAPFVLVRGITCFISVACNFYCIDHMNFADATMISKLCPVFTVFFSMLILGEKVSHKQAALLMGAFLSSALIIKPTGANAQLVPALVGVAGGVIAGFSVSFVRGADKAGATNSSILVALGLSPIIFLTPVMLFSFVKPSTEQWLMLALCGSCNAFAQFFLNSSYMHAEAKDLSVIDYSQMIYAMLISLILFEQFPDKYSILGYILVTGFSLSNFFMGRKRGTGQAI